MGVDINDFKEYFKAIPDYPDYEVSNLGNVKSYRHSTERILKNNPNKKGYVLVNLQPPKFIHQLMAMAFLGHEPMKNGLVVDHIDNNRSNNILSNLQLITQRENSSKDQWRQNHSSKYVGVSWCKRDKKWDASMRINGKSVRLGRFEMEEDASMSYSLKLVEIKNNRNYGI